MLNRSVECVTSPSDDASVEKVGNSPRTKESTISNVVSSPSRTVSAPVASVESSHMVGNAQVQMDNTSSQQFSPRHELSLSNRNAYQSDTKSSSPREMLTGDMEKNNDEESDSNSEFEWKPVKCSKTKENEMQWEFRKLSVSTQDAPPIDSIIETIQKDSDENGKEQKKKEKSTVDAPLSSSSSPFHRVTRSDSHEAKSKYDTDRLTKLPLHTSLSRKKSNIHSKIDNATRFKNTVLPRSRAGKYRLRAGEMDDATYLRTFGIKEFLSNLAMVLLEHKPEDYINFTKKWIQLLLDEEHKKRVSRQKHYYSHHCHGKRIRGRRFDSLKSLDLSLSVPSLSLAHSTRLSLELLPCRSDPLTKGRLKEVLKRELKPKRTSSPASRNPSRSSLTNKSAQNEDDNRSHKARSEPPGQTSRSSGTSNKCALKKRRSFSQLKLSDKVNDYLSKVEVTGMPVPMDSSFALPEALSVSDTDIPSPLHHHVPAPATEHRKRSNTAASIKTDRCGVSFIRTNFKDTRSPLSQTLGFGDKEEKKNLGRFLSSSTDLQPTERCPSSFTYNISSTTVAFKPVKPLSATKGSLQSPTRDPGTSSFPKAAEGESNEIKRHKQEKAKEVNSFPVLPDSNLCLTAETDASDRGLSGMGQETKMATSQISSLPSSTFPPTSKFLHADKDNEQNSLGADNELVTFAPVITLDRETAPTLGQLRASNEGKAGLTNNSAFPAIAAQGLVASTVSTPGVSGARNSARESVTNARANRLAPAAAEIPAKLLAAIAPTTISNANRAAQQKLASSGVANSASAPGTSKSNASVKTPSMAGAIGSDTNLPSSRSGTLGQVNSATIGSTRVKLHSLASGSDTITNKSKLAFIRGPNEHSSPAPQLTPPPSSMSATASPLSLSQKQAHSFQTYTNGLKISMNTGPNTASSNTFPGPNSPFYTTESAIDNRVDLVPLFPLDNVEKATLMGENVLERHSSAMPMPSGASTGAGAAWRQRKKTTIGSNTVIGAENETKVPGIAKQNLLIDIDMLSPKATSMQAGYNAALARGSSLSTVQKNSPAGSLFKLRGESILTSDSGCWRWQSDRYLTPTDCSTLFGQTDLLSQINSTLGQISKAMYPIVLSFLEGLAGKVEEHDANSLGLSLRDSVKERLAITKSPSFRTENQPSGSINFGNTSLAFGHRRNSGSVIRDQPHTGGSISTSIEISKGLRVKSGKSSKMQHAWSCPTLSDMQWPKEIVNSFELNSLSEARDAFALSDARSDSQFPQAQGKTLEVLRVNFKDALSEKASEPASLEQEAAVATPPSNTKVTTTEQDAGLPSKVSCLQKSIRAFAASVAPYAQLRATTPSTSPPLQGQLPVLPKHTVADLCSGVVDATNKKALPLHNVEQKSTNQLVCSLTDPDGMFNAASSYGLERVRSARDTDELPNMVGSKFDKDASQSLHRLAERSCCTDVNTPTNEVLSPEPPLSTISSKSVMTHTFPATRALETLKSEGSNANFSLQTVDTEVEKVNNVFPGNAHQCLKLASVRTSVLEPENWSDFAKPSEEREWVLSCRDLGVEIASEENKDIGGHEKLEQANSKYPVADEKVFTGSAGACSDADQVGAVPQEFSEPCKKIMSSDSTLTTVKHSDVEDVEKKSSKPLRFTCDNSLNSEFDSTHFLTTAYQRALTCNNTQALRVDTLDELKTLSQSPPVLAPIGPEIDTISPSFSSLPSFPFNKREKLDYRRRHDSRLSDQTSKATLIAGKKRTCCSKSVSSSCSSQGEGAPYHAKHTSSHEYGDDREDRWRSGIKKNIPQPLRPYSDEEQPTLTSAVLNTSHTDPFLSKTEPRSTPCNQCIPRSVSLNIERNIYPLLNLPKQGSSSFRMQSSRKARSLSATRCNSYSSNAKLHDQLRQPQPSSSAHSECSPSLLTDGLSTKKHESEREVGEARNVLLLQKHSHKDHSAEDKKRSHHSLQNFCRTSKMKDGLIAPCSSNTNSPNNLEGSLLERTMYFLHRKGHLEASNYPVAASPDLSTWIKSPNCLLIEAPNAFPGSSLGYQCEKSTVHDTKLDYAIAMTALAVAEDRLNSRYPCRSDTSADRLLTMADRIYSNEVHLSTSKEDYNRTTKSNQLHGATSSQVQIPKPICGVDGSSVTAQKTKLTKEVLERSSTDAEERQVTCDGRPNSFKTDGRRNLSIYSEAFAVTSDHTCDKVVPSSPKSRSALSTAVEKRLPRESTFTSSLDSVAKGLCIPSEELDSIREAFSKSTIFSAFHEKSLQTLLLSMTRHVINVNDVLVRQGAMSLDSVILVSKGSLSVMRNETVLQTVRAGGLYGEMEFFDQRERSPVTLVSKSVPGSTVFLFPNKDLQNIVVAQKEVLRFFLTKYLDRFPIFQRCPKYVKLRFSDALKLHRVEKGTILVEQGNPVQCLYVVMSGSVGLTFAPEMVAKETNETSTTETKAFRPRLFFSESERKEEHVSFKMLSQDRDKSPSVSEQTDSTRRRSTNPTQASQPRTSEMVSSVPNNGVPVSVGIHADSLLAYSTDDSENMESLNSNQGFNCFTLPTSTYVQNKKNVGEKPPHDVARSDMEPFQPNIEARPQEADTTELQVSIDSFQESPSLRWGPGSLVGEVEFIFRTSSFFTIRAESTLQVACINRLDFDSIMSKEALTIFRGVIISHLVYKFWRKVAARKMRKLMSSGASSKPTSKGGRNEKEEKVGSSSSNTKYLVKDNEKRSRKKSLQQKYKGRNLSRLAMIEQLPPFRKISSHEKLNSLNAESQNLNKTVASTEVSGSCHSYTREHENSNNTKEDTTSHTPIRLYRSVNDKYDSAESLFWHRINPGGEIVFSGSRSLYRFPLEALCANNTIVIAIIKDGTIIQWNLTAQHVLGYTPFEVIGQSIYSLMSCEDSRKKLQTMLNVANQFVGKWDSYVAAELNLQKIFSFSQNTGLSQIDVALSVIPSMCSSSSEVFLLVGRESKYHAAANYSADVVSWLNERMRPQLSNFHLYVSYIESKKWMITLDDAILLRRHLDACMITVEHLARLSLLTMETVRDSLRPTQLIIPIRRFLTQAYALIRNTNCSLFCKTDDIVPTLKVFLDAEKVIMFLHLLIKDVLNSVEYNPTMHVDIELWVTIVEPESTLLDQKLKPGVGQQQRARHSPTQQGHDLINSSATPAGISVPPIPLVGNGSTTFHTSPLDGTLLEKNVTSAEPEKTKSTARAASPNNLSESKESKASAPYSSGLRPSASSACPASNTEQDEGIDLQLSSLRRICFELRDNGLTIPLFHTFNDESEHFEAENVFNSSSLLSKSIMQTVLTPTTKFAEPMFHRVVPYNSPVESNKFNQAFPATGIRNTEKGQKFMNHRHRGEELQHVEKIVSAMGGMLRCFTRPEVEGNVVRVELPLLSVPGSKEEVVEDAGVVKQVVSGGRSFTVIVAENNHVHQNHLCHILWSRQHAVIPVKSFDELMRKVKSNTADILIIDPLQIDLDMASYIKRHGSDPFDDILESTSRMVLVVVGMDFSDWRVQKLLDRNSVIEVPKLGSAALMHIAMQEAEQMVTEMRDEEDRIEQLRSNFTNSEAGRHKIGRLLGKGTFGDVYEVKDMLTSGKMAMKRMQLHEGSIVDEVVQEILAMTSLQHENIIHYFYCEKETDTMLRLYMELAPGGTLRNKIRENPGVGLPFEEIVQRLTDICRGLAYVHSQHYVHCDLKTANLLIGTRGRTKIGDFGTAKQLAPGQKLYKLLGTPPYMAPEVLMADAEQRIGYDYKADVWSVGCIALEMATGLPPFSHIEESHGMGMIKYLSELTDTPDLSPLFTGNPLIYEFVKACLEINPELRPTAQELLHFDILQGMVTSIRAERIMKRAEMLYKLNKYGSIRPDKKVTSDDELGSEPGLMDTIDTWRGGSRFNYTRDDHGLRSPLSTLSSSKSSFTSTSSAGSALSSNWSVESLHLTVSSNA